MEPTTSPIRPTTTSPSRMLAISRRFGRIGSRFAGSRWFPFWAILRHTGRRSGTAYATPIVARPVSGGFAIPVPFGDGTQWVRNVVAAGGATIRVAGREHQVADPVPATLDELRGELGPVVGGAARLFGIRRFLRVRTVDHPSR